MWTRVEEKDDVIKSVEMSMLFSLSPFDRVNKRVLDVMYAYICPRSSRRFLITIRARISLYSARSINKTLIFSRRQRGGGEK
jgi:hypothetical protein